jgi:NAD(P) transhydrogenase subunit alpha
MEHLLFHPVGFIVALAMMEGTKELAFNPAVLIASLYVFALAAFLGYQVISRVPPLLHTPLMTSAMINVTGGFLITDRMLKMFRKKEAPKTEKPEEKK